MRNMSSDLPSLGYPTARLGNPGLVAYLLRVYIWNMVQGAFPPRDHLPVGGHAEWVPIPHTSFYAESGLFSRHSFGGAQAKCLRTAGVTTVEPGSGGKKPKPKEKQQQAEEPEDDDALVKDEKQQRRDTKQLLCPYHLRSLLGMKLASGELKKCKFPGPKCSRRHFLSLKEITKEEAMLATAEWTGEDQQARDQVTSWKS